MRLLIVEDDPQFGAALQRFLGGAGFAADWAQSGGELAPALAQNGYDCILLDLTLPDLSGEEALRSVRALKDATPLIAITARDGVADRIRLLDMGADDYLTKPVDLDEVAARVRAVVRRAQPAPTAEELTHGALRLDPARHRALWHGEPVALTPKEYALLEVLVRAQGGVLSRSRLEQALDGADDETASNKIEVHVHHLRRKFAPGIVQTERGLGYRLGPVVPPAD